MIWVGFYGVVCWKPSMYVSMMLAMSLEGLGRGWIGLVGLIAICWALSRDRKGIDWPLVGKLLLFQVVLALVLFKLPGVVAVFDGVAGFFVQTLAFTETGTKLLLGDDMGTGGGKYGFIILFHVLPTIIFFSALTSALYYLGVLQWIIYGFAWLMHRTMRISGAESLAAAANVFIGQTEAPLVVKPYIDRMTRSEMMCLMTGGMATIAGGVFVAYVGILGGEDEAARKLFGRHLLMASVLSAPAAILAAKMLIPERETFDVALAFPREKAGSNVLDAICMGTTEGVKLCVNVAAMLLVFTAFIAMANFFLIGFGSLTGINEMIGGADDGLTLQWMLGWCLAPVAWLIGVENGDLRAVGQLLGIKTILNEFVAYLDMGQMLNEGQLVGERSRVITTYALCGFANFASIGIQIGGIGVLAPKRRVTLSELGLWALVGGTVACLMTACVAGMLL